MHSIACLLACLLTIADDVTHAKLDKVTTQLDMVMITDNYDMSVN